MIKSKKVTWVGHGGEEKMLTKFWLGSLKERDISEDPGA
jgi:hypothetical protein